MIPGSHRFSDSQLIFLFIYKANIQHPGQHIIAALQRPHGLFSAPPSDAIGDLAVRTLETLSFGVLSGQAALLATAGEHAFGRSGYAVAAIYEEGAATVADRSSPARTAA